MRKLRVLINATALSGEGGGRNYLVNLLRELAVDDRGFDVTVVAVAGRLDPGSLNNHPILEVQLPLAATTALRVLYEQVVLPLRARHFDLLFCPTDIAPLWGPAPVVLFLRNLNIYDRSFYDTPRTRVLYRLARRAVLHAGAVVCPSEAASRQIGRLLGLSAHRIQVVRHGISAGAFVSEAHPAEGRPYLFLPANLERHKNFEVVFDALLRVSNPGLQLLIAGGDRLDPTWAAHLRNRVEAMGLQERVRFLGPVPYGEIMAYHRGALALVAPSLLETFGHPILEAMLAETPIIASDIPAFREVAGDAAVFFPPRDPAALAAAIDLVAARGPDVRARIERGRARVSEFTWGRAVDELCAVFESVVRNR